MTINFGAGTDQKKLEKGIKLVKMITGKEPVRTKTNKEFLVGIKTWLTYWL